MSAPGPLVLSALAPWKTKRFRDYELSWPKAVESLSGDNPTIDIRPNKGSTRWTVFDRSTNKAAVFYFAGLWLWGSPPETGNFVPDGETVPDGVPQGRVSNYLTPYIETSYAFNTEYDPSFYTIARASLDLEAHLTSNPDFNKNKSPRRSWQDGVDEFTRNRFIIAARLLIQRNAWNSKPGVERSLPYKLHPWLRTALEGQTAYLPNPEVPAIVDYVDGRLTMLRPSSSDYFRRGDIVWFSFTVAYQLNTRYWEAKYRPLDFVRVGHVELPVDSRPMWKDPEDLGSIYQSFTSGAVSLMDDANDEEQNALKRVRDSDGDETMSDGESSGKSAYSAQAALEPPNKRAKLDDVPAPVKPISASTTRSGTEDRRKVGGKKK
ncbi:hypothetical protein B0H16DRAFT_1460656 [Mycena metata]|uniref:Uncharacterized protein n=1 Tax=Mycena metata TaxID=1033252 RepID=A0AAD7N8R2_9AGAR|nr:hypothetical protein B0H16DRAFT_1460656 [Mycena metata]